MRDVGEIKARIGGDWRPVLIHFGFRAEDLDGKHHPCPKAGCGGVDRFRLVDSKTGNVLCSHCFKKSEKQRDGIAAIGWLNGWDFKTTILELCKYLWLNGNGRGDFTAGNSPRGDGKSRGKAIGQAKPRVRPFGKPIKKYPYEDWNEVTLRYKVRTDPKGFFWMAPDGTKNVDGIPETLYRLPRLRGQTEIWIVEGEKDADTLLDWDLPATTSGGVDSWHDCHTEQFLESGCRQAVIIPDNDKEKPVNVGLKHALDIAATLTAKKVEVRVLNLGDAKDITDWKERGGDLEGLLELAANAPIWKAPKRRFEPLRYSEVLAIPAPTWLLKPLLPAESLIVLWGPPGSGKSFVTMSMGLSIASGQTFCGLEVKKPGKVFYAFGEGLSGAGKRFLAWQQGRRNEAEVVPVLEENLLSARFVPDLGDPAQVKEFIGEIPRGTVMVAIDTLARALPGRDENASKDMGAAVASADWIIRETGASVLLVHHCGWEAKHSRGSNSLPGGIHTELSFNEGCLEVRKQKDLEPAKPFYFQLVVTTVGIDVEGEPITTCRVQLDAYPDLPQGQAGRKILELLNSENWKNHALSPKEIRMLLGDMKEQTFYDAIKKLVEKGLIRKEKSKYKTTGLR